MPRNFVSQALLAAAIIASRSRTSLCFTPSPSAHTTKRTSSCQDASASASSDNGFSRDDNERKSFLPSWLDTPLDSEAKHFRRQTTSRLRRDNVYMNDWRVERYDRPEPCFPDTLDSVTDAAWEAIAGTLYRMERLDPNVASNAMSRSLYSFRPVRRDHDVGRIGIEIDGPQFMFRPQLVSSGTAIRRVALELGAKLSAGPWQGFEGESCVGSRPIAIYFNTIKQSLAASQELLMLKRIAKEETGSSERYDNITIKCLQQDDDVPRHMRQTERRRGSDLFRGDVDPTKGLLLVVQPTDYNSEFRPPGPSIGTVGSLQQLAARASIHGLPVVLISPRFLAHEYHAKHRGWDQSGYQRSAVFGGAEPPKGPTPWLLRDFTPPVFSYVGCALSLSTHHEQSHNIDHADRHDESLRYSRVVCTQSVMQEGHPFHMFAVCDSDSSTKYQYLASTKTSSGRPPKDIIQHIFNEWS